MPGNCNFVAVLLAVSFLKQALLEVAIVLTAPFELLSLLGILVCPDLFIFHIHLPLLNNRSVGHFSIFASLSSLLVPPFLFSTELHKLIQPFACPFQENHGQFESLMRFEWSVMSLP